MYSQFNILETKKKLIIDKNRKMQIKEFEVPLGYGFLKGQIFGEIKPDAKPIVSLHGHLDNSNSFRPIAKILTKNDYYLIALDMPGHGLR